MSAAAVLAVLDLLAAAGVTPVVDGGWGVDALLGRQTREHTDLDLAVPTSSQDAAVAALRAAGFRHLPRDDDTPHGFVLARGDTVVDLHFHGFAGDEPVASIGIAYPRESLTGHGVIEGRPVACVPPEWVIRFHSGYPLDADDLADVRAVSAAFGVPLLDEHLRGP